VYADNDCASTRYNFGLRSDFGDGSGRDTRRGREDREERMQRRGDREREREREIKRNSDRNSSGRETERKRETDCIESQRERHSSLFSFRVALLNSTRPRRSLRTRPPNLLPC
jgi:hypothetical protein